MGAVTTRTARGTVYCLTVVGQIEGHSLLPNTVKTTKYEHVLPLLAALDESEEIDGVLLLLSMYDRSYSLYVRDGYAQSMIGSYAQQQLEDSFLDYLGDDDWYGGFHTYLTTCADMMQQASEGHAVRKPLGKVIFPALLVGCGVALAVCLVLKGKMKSVRRGAEADVYVTAEGLDLTERSDIYTHTTETRRKKEKNDSQSESGGGGSGRSGHF